MLPFQRSMRQLSHRTTHLTRSRPQRNLTTSALRPTTTTLFLTSPTTASLSPRQYSTQPSSTTTSTPESQTPSPSTPLPHPVFETSHLDAQEKEIHELLVKELQPTALEVQDVSGGCGSMYALSVTSEKFRGLSTMKQHRLVNGVLGEKVKGWHGVQIRCFVPEGK